MPSVANPLSAMTRWLRGGTRRGVVRPPEPADLGTAFGMECWLDEVDSSLSNAPVAPAAQSRWPAWLRRQRTAN